MTEYVRLGQPSARSLPAAARTVAPTYQSRLNRPGSSKTSVVGEYGPRAASNKRRATETMQESPRSLFEQVTDVFKSVPAGVGALAGQIGQTTVAPLRFLRDVGELAINPDATGNPLRERLSDGFDLSDIGGFNAEYAPFVSNMQSSLGQTGYRLIHPTQYTRAIEEGRIVDTVLEDIGNVAMVAGGASKALGTVATQATVPIRIAQALEEAGVAGRVGRTAGAALADDAAITATARQLRRAARTASREVGPAPTYTNAAGEVLPVTRNITLRGRGIAGAMDRAGMTAEAKAVARAGERIGTVARLGEKLDDVQLAWPARAATKPFRMAWGSEKLNLPSKVAGQIERMSAGEGVLARVAGSFTPNGRAGRMVQSTLAAEQTARQRQSMAPARLAGDLDLERFEQRMAANIADNRFDNLVNRYRENRETMDAPGIGRFADSTALNETIDRTFGDMPIEARPTVEDVRLLADYYDDQLDPATTAKVEQVVGALRGQSAARTQELRRQDALNPEQLEPQLMESEIARQQSGIARSAERARKEWETSETAALRADRVAAARVAVNRALPPVPDVKAVMQAGANQGRALERAKVMQAEMQSKQRQLRDAVEQYVKLEEGDTPARRAAERNVERLTEQVDALEGELRRQTRQADAMKGLERADVDQRQRVVEEPGTAQVDLAGAQSVLDDVKGEVRRELADEKDRLAPSGPPTRITAAQRRSELGGEHDYWVFRPPSELTREQRNRIDRYERAGFLRTAKRGESFNPDQWVMESPELRHLSVDEALERWFDLADRVLDMNEAGWYDEVMIERAAARLDMDPVVLDDALRAADTSGRGPTNRTSFRQSLMRRVDEALTELHDGYASLDPLTRQALDDVLDEYAQQPDLYDGADVFDIVDTYVEGAGGNGGLFHRLGDGGITTEQALEFMRTGQITESFFEAVQRPPSVAQRMQQARLGGTISGTKKRMADAVRASKSARTTLDRVNAVEQSRVTEAAREVDRAAKAVEQVEGKFVEATDAALDAADEAADAADAATYDEVVVDKEGKERTVTRQPWKATRGRDKDGNVTNPLPPAARQLVDEGVLTGEAGRLATEARRKRRTYDRWNDKLGGLRGKLGRSWQDRLTTEVNKPAVNGMRNVIRQIAPRFGDVLPPEFDADGNMLAPPRVTGLMGQLADRYGFADELSGVLLQMKADVNGRALRAIDTAGAFFGVAKDMGITFEQVAETALNDSWQTDWLLEQINDIEYGAVDDGTRLNSPYRVIDLIEQQDWIPKKLPDDAGSQLRSRADAYRRRRANYLGRLMDDQLRAVPARFRAPIINARRDIATFLEMAEDYNRQVDGSGDVFLRMAEDSVTTLTELVEAGIDPTHLIGGKVIERPGSGGFGGGVPMTRRKLMAEHELTTGLRPMDLSTYARTEAREAMTILRNDTSEVVAQQFGRPAADVISDVLDEHLRRTDRPMTAEAMTKAVDEAGYAPMGNTVMTRETVVVPKIVKDEMTRWSNPGGGVFWQALRSGNRAFKSLVLPFSTRWHVGNIIGNAFMAVAQGGMGPIELARTMQQLASSQGGWWAAIKKEGMPWWAPDELANHGLSYGEHQMMWDGLTVESAQSKYQKLVAGSFHFNQFADNMFRSSVYLSKLGKGVPSDVAMRQTLRAMGDYTRMTSFERRVVREVFPFYAWLRHQTLAAVRLPMYSPTRAAYLYSLANIFADEEATPEMMALLGSRIPLGGGTYLNAGNISPFGNPLSLALNPSGTEFSRSISPVIGFPVKAIMGYDVDRARGITRPADTAHRGVYGEEQTTSPVRRITEDGDILAGLGELGWMAAGEVPYLGQARNMIFGGQRYDTGQLRPTQHDNRARSLTETVPSLLGLPAVQFNVNEDTERVDELNGGEARRRRLAELMRQTQGG